MTKDECAIEVRGLFKSFGKLQVLKGIDLFVKRGTIVALLGPNGSGKTTIVRILSTLLRADGGDVRIEGHDVVKDAQSVRSIIGLTGQYAALDEYLTGRENLKMMGRLYHLSKGDTTTRTEELLVQFDLVEAANRYVRTYSGGMRRRLDLAASLIATPPILFLDEPTTALDPRSRFQMWEIIEDLVRQGTTILLTTQHLEEADRLADYVVVIDEGKVIAKGTTDQLKHKVGTERVQFTFDQHHDLDKATQLMAQEAIQIDKKQRSITVSNEHGISKLKQLLQWFEESGIQVSGVSCSKPTLDDAFIKLTGHKATSEDGTGTESPSQPPKTGNR